MSDFLSALDNLTALNEATPGEPTQPSADEVNNAVDKAWSEAWLVDPEVYSDVASAYHKFEASLKTLAPSDPADPRLVSQFTAARDEVISLARMMNQAMERLGDNIDVTPRRQQESGFGNVRPPRLLETVGQIRKNKQKGKAGAGYEASSSMAIATSHRKSPGPPILANVVDGKLVEGQH